MDPSFRFNIGLGFCPLKPFYCRDRFEMGEEHESCPLVNGVVGSIPHIVYVSRVYVHASQLLRTDQFRSVLVLSFLAFGITSFNAYFCLNNIADRHNQIYFVSYMFFFYKFTFSLIMEFCFLLKGFLMPHLFLQNVIKAKAKFFVNRLQLFYKAID